MQAVLPVMRKHGTGRIYNVGSISGERDLNFRKKQAKSDVQTCAKRLALINEKKKLKVRYTIGVSWIYRIFTKMPDGLKEWAIRRFN